MDERPTVFDAEPVEYISLKQLKADQKSALFALFREGPLIGPKVRAVIGVLPRSPATACAEGPLFRAGELTESFDSNTSSSDRSEFVSTHLLTLPRPVTNRQAYEPDLLRSFR